MEQFNWTNRTHLFDPANFKNWGNTHGQVPYFIDINGQKKIFFTSRPPVGGDGSYVSFIHAVDVVYANGEMEVTKLFQKPFLSLGEVGCFDEFGSMPCSVIQHPSTGEIYLYYVGWSRKVSAPYDCAIGLAISKDGGLNFEKIANGPLIGANVDDPFVLGCPRVSIFNNKWYMFYLAGINWFDSNGRKECYYKLKIAVSDDGKNWTRNDRYIIPERYENECQTCASVFFWQNKYHMYFTYRHSVDFRNPERGYRIGYASSTDLENWERNDEVGNFSISEGGWDSEMVCYPNVNLVDDKLLMFYCGNSFGLHGFGFAELQKK